MENRSWSTSTDLESRLGYNFNRRQRLITAITHTTFSEENRVESNQRLKFLGDTVVELVISQMLMEIRSEANEGELTKLRSRLTNGDFFANFLER